MANVACWNRDGHRDRWRVLTRDRIRYHRDDIGWATPGTSTLVCEVCHVAWRSKAKYVAEIPDVATELPIDNPVPARIAEQVALHPQLAELTYWTEKHALAGVGPVSKDLLHEVGQWFCRTGRLTPRQQEWAIRLVDEAVAKANAVQARWAVEKAAQDAEKAAQDAVGRALAPEGEQVARGVVERVWWLGDELFASPAGLVDTPKMRVRTDDGWVVEVTVPAVLRRAVDMPESLVGRRVEVRAQLRRSKDLTMAWGRNPQQDARLLD